MITQIGGLKQKNYFCQNDDLFFHWQFRVLEIVGALTLSGYK